MRVKIFDLSWNVDLNRLENEINAFLATLPSNAVKYVQSAASSIHFRAPRKIAASPDLCESDA